MVKCCQYFYEIEENSDFSLRFYKKYLFLLTNINN